jgi:hypothetical protein
VGSLVHHMRRSGRRSGYPFIPVAKTVASDGSVRDEAAAMTSGYTMLQAESLEDAAVMAQSCPVLESGGKVSVFETFEMSQPEDEMQSEDEKELQPEM